MSIAYCTLARSSGSLRYTSRACAVTCSRPAGVRMPQDSQRAGLDDLHLADLRHEAASRLEAAGVPTTFVSKFLRRRARKPLVDPARLPRCKRLAIRPHPPPSAGGLVPEDRARSATVERLSSRKGGLVSESRARRATAEHLSSRSAPTEKAPESGAFLSWCGRGDSNPHGIATASPSSWCVCQFRHFRVRGSSTAASLRAARIADSSRPPDAAPSRRLAVASTAS